ncbi:MAG TPA: arsenite methyltransferase [Miltoncostaeaceae bacterium]|nr:arsenite methyltransferase [Miltoncostaeaceae bacterium]
MSAGDVHERVRERYAAAAREAAAGAEPSIAGGCGEGGCCSAPAEAVFGPALYGDADRGQLPETAVLASLGCGNPAAVAELREGEVVLDLGSGGGIDVLLSARRVGPAGKAYGLDMTEEMLALARRNAADAGATNIEFLKGHIEQIPLPAETIDVVISNCVVNLSPDKAAVLSEAFRVLRPGGRLGITDVVAEDRLSEAERAERGDWAGCIAGALAESEYARLLARAGFDDVRVTFTHDVADGLHGAIVSAVKPAGAATVLPEPGAGAAASPGCC